MKQLNETRKNIVSDIQRYNSCNARISIITIFKALSKIGFWAVLNYRIGLYLRILTRDIFLIKQIVWILTGLSRLIINFLSGIDISYQAKIGGGLYISHFSNIFISSKAIIGVNATLHQGVTIGKGGVFSDSDEPCIGNNFFAGANSVIIGGISIGDNVCIGASTCCYKNIPSNCTVVSGTLRVIEN